jgi:signal transduction histidine kinase/GAF domain-containing protein
MLEKKDYVSILFGTLFLLGLHLISLSSYLLFHSLVEIFSVVVACSIFILVWNSRSFLENTYLLFIGPAYLYIAGLDFVHTLTYQGMGVFQGYGTNLPTQLWIAARYMESLSLLIAPLFFGRKLKIKFVFFAYTFFIFLILGSIFYWKVFPVCFVEGVGLTHFKKISEYIIFLILSVSIVTLLKNRLEFDAKALKLIVGSVVLTMGSELAFTFYVHAYGLSNLVGHYLKVVSFYLLYKAIVETGLQRPYAMLFRNLKQGEKVLRYRLAFEDLISKLSTRLISMPPEEIQGSIEEALEEIGQFAKADGGYVFLFSDDMKRFSMTHLWRNENLGTQKEVLQDLEVSSMPWWTRQILRGQPVIVPSVSNLPKEAAVEKRIIESQGIQSLIDVPIVCLENIIGFVGFSCVSIHRDWSEDDILLLKMVGEVIANALNRKKAEEALRESGRELSIRNQIAKVFLTTSGDEMYGEVLHVVLEAMESEYGTFGYINEKGERVVPSMTRGIWDECKILKKDIIFPREKWGNNLWARSLIEKKAVSSNGPFKVPDGHIPITTALAVPILHKGEAIGNFMVGNKATDYDQRDENLLKTIADHTAPILDAWLRKERQEKERRQAEEEIKSVAKFPSENPNPVFRVTRDGTVIYANEASLPLLDNWGCQVSQCVPGDLTKLIPDVLGCGISKETEVQFGDRVFSLTFAPVVKADYVNIYGLDITHRKRAEEMLQEANDELERRVEERTVELRSLSDQLLRIQESERRRIAMELHDSIGQSLAATKFVAEHSLNQIRQGQTEDSIETLESLVPLIQQAGEEVRRIHTELRPPLLDDLGLLSTIAWFCREFGNVYSDIRIQNEVDIQEKEIPEPLKIVIFRLLQESLNNAAKYSKADVVQASLRGSDGQIELVIEDNGEGFDVEQVHSVKTFTGGFGLTSMKERTELSGGTFTIESTPGEGTVVRALWPI